MTPRQIAGYLALNERRERRKLATQLSLMQVATSHDRRAIKARLRELLKDSD